MPRCVVWNVYSCITRRPRMKPQRKTELGPMWILRFALPWNSVIVAGKFPVCVNHTESRDEDWIRHQADSAMGTLIWKGWVGKQNLCCEVTERNRGCQHIGGCWKRRVRRKTWAIITGAFLFSNWSDGYWLILTPGILFVLVSVQNPSTLWAPAQSFPSVGSPVHLHCTLHLLLSAETALGLAPHRTSVTQNLHVFLNESLVFQGWMQ